MEHFKLDDSVSLLKAIKKSLKQGAYIRIIVPNFSLILQKLREHDFHYFAPFFNECKSSTYSMQDILYFLCSPTPKSALTSARFPLDINTQNNQSYELTDSQFFALDDSEILDICNNHEFDNNSIGSYHLSAYTAKSLISILSELGFSQVYESHFMQSSFGPMRETPLFDGTHPWMSLYVEARL